MGVPPDRVEEAERIGGPNELLDVPGVCVKTYEKDNHIGFPKHCGVLVSYSEGKVVVRGHGSVVSPKCVWIGTADEYRKMWEVD